MRPSTISRPSPERDQRERKDHDRDHRDERPAIYRGPLALRHLIDRRIVRLVKQALDVGERVLSGLGLAIDARVTARHVSTKSAG